MGMYLTVTPVSDATIERIHADPRLVWRLLDPENADRIVAERAPKPGLLSRILGRTPSPPPPLPALDFAPGEGEAVNVDKAWHGLHWLLTGTADEGELPLSFLLAGGREVDDGDADIGNTHTLSARETRDVAAALDWLSDDDLRARFDAAEMTRLDLYPGIWDRGPEDDPLEYLMAYAGALREAVRGAVRNGLGLLIHVG